MHLGVRAIAAGSYARIHRRNLIAVGVVPLVISDDDRAAAAVGQRWQLPDLGEAVRSGADVVSAKVDGEQEIRLSVELSAGEPSPWSPRVVCSPTFVPAGGPARPRRRACIPLPRPARPPSKQELVVAAPIHRVTTGPPTPEIPV